MNTDNDLGLGDNGITETLNILHSVAEKYRAIAADTDNVIKQLQPLLKCLMSHDS